MENLLKALTTELPEQTILGGEAMINGHDDAGSQRTAAETEPDQSPQYMAGPIQMIGGDGTFYKDDTSGFITDSKELMAHGATYAVISLLGSQSPGKGFLCNSLFSGNINTIDASKGRGQNTKGVWLTRCTGPSLLVMDFDFSDAKEDYFEKQSILFALAVSDLLMVNMSFQDFNRDQAGTFQLIKALFKERVKIDPGQTKMLVILHGYDDKPPLAKLQEDVFAKMEKLWASIHNKPDSPTFLFSDFFEVLVVGFPDKSKANDFEEKVSKMRRWFGNGEILGFKQDKISALGFTLSAKGIWETIRQKKRLNLLGNRLTVSSFCCERIVREKLDSLTSTSEDILVLKKSSEGFSDKLQSFLDVFLTRYDIETQMYEADVKMQNRHELEVALLKRIESLCKDVLTEMHTKAFYESKEEIANKLNKSDDPVIAINDVVDACVNKFVESCLDLKLNYQDLCNEHIKSLRRELTALAEIIAENIKEREKRKQAEKSREEAFLQIQKTKLESSQLKKECELKLTQYKTESETSKNKIQQISQKSFEQIQRISQERECLERETERLREEIRKEREKEKERESEAAKRRGIRRRFGIVRAVFVVARVVVLKDPTVIVDILEFALWNKCHGSGNGKDS